MRHAALGSLQPLALLPVGLLLDLLPGDRGQDVGHHAATRIAEINVGAADKGQRGLVLLAKLDDPYGVAAVARQPRHIPSDHGVNLPVLDGDQDRLEAWADSLAGGGYVVVGLDPYDVPLTKLGELEGIAALSLDCKLFPGAVLWIA